MRLAGVGPGDEVITSPFSFVASANCALYEGATPVFADIDPRTLNLDPAAVEAAITAAHARDPRRRHLRLPLRARRAAGDRRAPRARAHRGRLRGARREVQGPAARLARPSRRLRLLPEQADDDRRGRRGRHRSEERVARCSRASPTRAGPTPAAGSSTRGSATTTASTTSPRRSASRSSSGSTRFCARGSAAAARYAELLAGRRRRRASARRRRRPPPLVVRLPRSARARDRPRAGDRARSRERASQTSRYLPSIHLQPYMRERFGFREGMFPVSEEASRRLLALPFHSADRRRGPGARRRRAARAPWR